jgi:hypothetical protein
VDSCSEVWRFKTNENDEDTCMAAPGIIFLASQISRGIKDAFLVKANTE